MIGMLAMTASMLLVGWIIWKAINSKEDGDAELQAKLDADDRRAAIGRGENPDQQHRTRD
ncbi:MAG: hypothetical protein CMJ67_08685 [Planctomycetaceae bacterium]|nr:hypothetical protein [Planctomycetaceae bacterium]